MDIKIIFTIIATIVGTYAFFPYIKDIFSQKTKPHIYTWLIWAITQTTAIAGILYGGGSWGSLNLIAGTLLIFSVFFFSLKYGTKNITKSDTIILILAFLAILVWWQLRQPVISIIMISIIDLLGYIPTFRKSYQEPWGETLTSWALFAISDIFAILALSQYNLLTTTYLGAITLANTSLFLFCYFRRFYISRPQINNRH